MRTSLSCVALIALLPACGGGGSTKIALPQWPSLALGSPNVGGEFGRAVALAGDLVAVGSPDRNQVHIYDAATGRLRHTLRGGARFGGIAATTQSPCFARSQSARPCLRSSGWACGMAPLRAA